MTDPAGPRLDERRPRGRRSLAFDLALALLAAGLERGIHRPAPYGRGGRRITCLSALVRVRLRR